MSKKAPTKESVHLKAKVALYEGFLFRYLPQLTALSFVTRINLFDAFQQSGLNKPGTQGTPFILFQVIHKQRQHQLKKQRPLKPFNLSLLSPGESPATAHAFEALQAANQESNSCKLACWTLSLSEGIRQLSRQLQSQPAGERNLLLLDPLNAPAILPEELRRLGDKKLVLILPLPLAALWQLQQKPEKEAALPGYRELKQAIDSFFPAAHPYWSVENTIHDFAHHLKEAFQMEELFYTAMEPAPEEKVPEMVLLGMATDAFMMEKVLQALQGLRPTATPSAGAQLGLFFSRPETRALAEGTETAKKLLPLLAVAVDNQDLYARGLQAGLLPGQLQQGLEHLFAEGKIEVLGGKGKTLAEVPKGCISFTAFKAVKSVCSFQLKDEFSAL